MNKEEQAKLLAEIMEADEKDGLYELPKPQTAVEWLEVQVRNFNDRKQTHYEYDQIFIQAKRMEKEQLNIARLDGINLANKGYGKK